MAHVAAFQTKTNEETLSPFREREREREYEGESVAK